MSGGGDGDAAAGCGGCLVMIVLFMICSGVLSNSGSRSYAPSGGSHYYSSSTPSPSYTSEKVQTFRAEQASTVTTHGPINMSSVNELPGGRMSYQTADGKQWVVEMTVDADGNYVYSAPQPAN